jgi:hypothetical protein
MKQREDLSDEREYLCPLDKQPLVRLPTGHHRCRGCGKDYTISEFSREVLHADKGVIISLEDERYLLDLTKDSVRTSHFPLRLFP